jgi:6-phosphogluconolactonase
MKKDSEVRIFPTADALFESAAIDFSERAQAAVTKTGIFSVALSGGSTPKLFFETLSHTAYCVENTPWNTIRFFFGDERYVPLNDINSNYHTAFEFLLSKVPVNPDNIFRIPTEFKDPFVAADTYETTLRRAFQLSDNDIPQFDLIYLGLGDNAHTASLMPNSDVVKFYARSQLPNQHQLATAVFIPETNLYRITLTPTVINNSRDILFLVAGADKARAISTVLEGSFDPLNYPAQLIPQ